MTNSAAESAIAEAIEAWGEHLRHWAGASEIHRRKSLSAVRRIVASAGWQTIADINRKDVVTWLTDYVASGRSRSTAAKMLSQMRQFGKYLVHAEIAPANPFDGLTQPPVRRVERGPGARAFTIGEVRRLITTAEQQEQVHGGARRWGPNRSVLYVFLARTGLRYSEATRARWADIEGDQLHVRDKSGRGDRVPIDAETAAALAELFDWRSREQVPAGDDPIFRRVSHHTLERDMARAGIPRRDARDRGGQWHSFRKCAITERLRAGVDPEKVRRLARHSRLDLTLGTYNDLRDDELAAASEALPTLNGFLARGYCIRGPFDDNLSMEPGGRRMIATATQLEPNAPPPDDLLAPTGECAGGGALASSCGDLQKEAGGSNPPGSISSPIFTDSSPSAGFRSGPGGDHTAPGVTPRASLRGREDGSGVHVPGDAGSTPAPAIGSSCRGPAPVAGPHSSHCNPPSPDDGVIARAVNQAALGIADASQGRLADAAVRLEHAAALIHQEHTRTVLSNAGSA